MDVHEARKQLSRLLEMTAAGEDIVISEDGRPVADLVPHRASPVRIGGMRGELRYDDVVLDADPDVYRMFYGDVGQ